MVKEAVVYIYTHTYTHLLENSYPGMSSEELLHEFLYYGVSAISLSTCGSDRSEGLRACVSLTPRRQFPILEERLKLFKENH